jgi:hypothetical protein
MTATRPVDLKHRQARWYIESALVPDPRAYRTLEFMRTTFLNSLSDLARDDQRRVIRALEQLDADEPVLSLRVHQLKGSRAGLWSASRNLRITFLRLEGGRKLLVECSHHYGD